MSSSWIDEISSSPVCEHGGALGTIRRAANQDSPFVVLCRGLTGSGSRASSYEQLAEVLGNYGWPTARFDYCGSLAPARHELLRTDASMVSDLATRVHELEARFGRVPAAVVARGYGARIALEALGQRSVVPLVMWAPILWLKTSLEIRFRLHELRQKGELIVDGTELSPEFTNQIRDLTHSELAALVNPERLHVIVHGEQDSVVPSRLIDEAADVIREAGGVVQVIAVPGGHPHPQEDVGAQIHAIADALGHLRVGVQG